MRNGIAGIDHVIIGVRDLERARMGWTRLGFTLSPRGRHLGQATANYCVMFPRDYLELLGIVGEDAHSHRWARFSNTARAPSAQLSRPPDHRKKPAMPSPRSASIPASRA